MNETPPANDSIEPSHNELAAVAEQVELVAVMVVWCFPVLGLISGAIRLLNPVDQPYTGLLRWPVAMLVAIYLVVAYSLAGFVLGTLLRALGRWLLVYQAEAIQGRSALAVSAASIPATIASPASPALELLKERTVAEIHHAIRGRNWEEAAALVEAFGLDHPDDPRIAAMQAELSAARDAARADLQASLDAARQVNDPDRVLELHDDLVPLLDFDSRHAFEADLAKWFLRLIHNCLRGGVIQPDVATLAGRVAEVFSHTTEGASLRASLPTLRRSAGLCPRCAQPYTGIADACPDCVKPAPAEPRPPSPQSS
jgi:hypothetical protein